jgi:F420H(2)-dependent quinone reductase
MGSARLAADQRRPPVGLFRVLNPVVRALLRSPLHRLLSNRLMLLSYHGRRTGRRYTIPVGYFPWDDGVLAFSSARWWVNLRDGQPAQLTIRGREHSATATVYDQTDDIAARLAQFTARFSPKAARGLILGLPAERPANQAELARAAARTALIHFHLQTPI